MEKRVVVWQYGALRLGIPVGVVAAVMQTAKSTGLQATHFLSGRFAITLTYWLVVGIFTGWLWGTIMWRWKQGKGSKGGTVV